MKILLVNNNSFYFGMLKEHLKRMCKVKVIHYKDVIKVVNKKFDGIVLSGSPYLATVLIKTERKFLDKEIRHKVPILGICAGLEVLAVDRGSGIKHHKKRVKGFNKIKILKRDKLFKGIPKEMMMFEDHINHVDKVPTGFELIATSSKTRIEAIKEKNIYGLQFHPEMSGYVGEIILKNFIEICDKHAKSKR